MNLILPTEQLLNNLKSVEPHFWFYEDGLAGALRDVILMHDEKEDSTILDYIFEQYSQTPQSIFQARFGSDAEAETMQMAIEWLYGEVEELMTSLFKQLQYGIHKQQYEWVGKDLLVTVEINDEDMAHAACR